MRAVAVIARILLGLAFFVFGLNGFLYFFPAPPLTGYPAQFMAVMVGSHYTYVIFGFQVLIGALLLFNQFVPLALAMLAPILVNILTYHVTMNPSGIGPGLFATLLWLILVLRYRSHFAPLFERKTRVD